MNEKRYVRGVDEIPAGIYQQNDDGTYSEAKPYKPPPIRWYLGRLFKRGAA